MSESEKHRSGGCPATEQTSCVRNARQFEGQRKWGSSEPYLNKVAILKALAIRSGQTIVDAGCGNGYMTRVLAQALEGDGTVYAIDREAPKALEDLTGPEGVAIRPLTADITGVLPLPDASVDLIYLSSVFHIFSDEQARGFNGEVQRLLKPGGRLAIVDMVKRPTPIGPPLHMRRSPEESQGLIDLTPAGLVEVGAYFYMQIFQQKG